jgi:hypothetical protein
MMIALAPCVWRDNSFIEGLTGPSSGQAPVYTLLLTQTPCLPLKGSVRRIMQGGGESSVHVANSCC